MNYEITFISDDNGNTTPFQTIQDLGGEILNVRDLGRLKFAYDINGRTAGNYTTISFKLDQTQQSQLLKRLNTANDILRFLIVKVPLHKINKPVKFREQLKEAKDLEETETSNLDLITTDTSAEGVTPEPIKVVEATKAKTTTKKRASKKTSESSQEPSSIKTEALDQARVKKLNEHLDKILGNFGLKKESKED